VEIGYTIAQASPAAGYGVEAVRALLGYLFTAPKRYDWAFSRYIAVSCDIYSSP
jgi:RimJ/RimL family protein N-acetyltransferase